jgi:hypothetical protein
MSNIVLVRGNVKYAITLDPGVWIFDDRKKRMNEFFVESSDQKDSQDYAETAAKLWDDTLKNGVTPKRESFVEKKDISGDWGIPFKPFLMNAEPQPSAREVVCQLGSGESVTLDIAQAGESILCFALDGRTIREDGPIHLYFADGSNCEQPIKGIVAFEVK